MIGTKRMGSAWEKWAVTALRCAIGWGLILDGLTRLPLGGAGDMALLSFAQITLGAVLFLGLATRWVALGTAGLLAVRYGAIPLLSGMDLSAAAGSAFLFNILIVQTLALLVLAVLRETGYGLQELLPILPTLRGADRDAQSSRQDSYPTEITSRREALLNFATLPALGILGGLSVRHSAAADALSGATIQINEAALSELKGPVPKGNIQDHEISRLVLGGNLIGGWAHSRDLLYVPELQRAYNTEERIYDTLMLAEQCGINAINIAFPSNPILKNYKDYTGSAIKVISQVAPDMNNADYFTQIDQAIDQGADILQIQGNWCDWLVRDERMDVIVAMLERIREQGYTAGLASHSIEALIACDDAGIIPDYYMKTMHHDQYWSAHPKENRVPFEVDGPRHQEHGRFHDNMFCLFPDRTVDFVARAQVPVMGYKVLAAGAIPPQDGFHWAFQNGADFICVGMFDFQIVNDANITIDVLHHLEGRTRPWFG